jgi:hypothetical protein
MLIRIGNFELDYVFGRRVSLTWGRFQLYCAREWQNPHWWFAKNDPGQPWERWGFGRHLICGIVGPERGFDYNHPNNSIDPQPCSAEQA